MYSDTGGNGPVVVLLHGVLVNGSIWKEVVDGRRMRAGRRLRGGQAGSIAGSRGKQ